MKGITIRAASPEDCPAISDILKAAFQGADEADLVDRLRQDNDVVLELVALKHETIVGHILFSRLKVTATEDSDAVALAPLAVSPDHQEQGIGSELVRSAHEHLASAGETLSVVLGEPEYYGRFGYEHQRASGFFSEYQGEYLQAVAFGDAPSSGTLIYAPAFGAL
ncbi:GNAT family N-acetyltransferase [Phyllobacterium brassicacearum]|uniref:GNAT family N-acetyltransferase n=1 Tax=Phyllobacterium brassicacearum TaxID=314235 RepID=A0A2P7BPA2_9HYPH|nr:N-acetyltransferase [Phyllobacterium brassicacearum]PSH68287.1 GNAT family N-acetyltransferase [Phyllobacterium brassicacearum]TDQ31867.1 putative acetyltransferase [Phyllobacterium brassicacearum]